MLEQALAAAPDALLVDSIITAALALPIAARKPQLPIIGVLHQPPGGVEAEHDLQRATLQSALDRRFYAEATRLIVPSETLAATVRASGVAGGRVRVVTPGKDPIAAAGPEIELSRQAGLAFLCVANWLPVKGLLTLLEALALLPPNTATLHLVGDPNADSDYGATLRERLARPDLAGRVVVHGTLPPAEVAACYRAADAFVLASEQESYGMVVAEAMTAGLPVIATCVGNLLHLIKEEVDGILVEPGDVPGLAHAIERLARDGALRRRLGENARRRAATWPTWDQTAARFVAVVREAISDYRAGRGEEDDPWSAMPSG